MSKLLQLRGGTTSEHGSFTGAVRETTVDTTKDTLVVHDGSTAGGFALARESALTTTTATAAAALPKSGGVVTGLVNMSDQIVQRPVLKDYAETKVAMAAHAVDLELGNVFTYTLSGAQTLTFTNPAASGSACSFTLILSNGGSAALTFPSSVDWAAATAPTLSSAGVDVLTFTSIDGGTIWYGIAAGIGMA